MNSQSAYRNVLVKLYDRIRKKYSINNQLENHIWKEWLKYRINVFYFSNICQNGENIVNQYLIDDISFMIRKELLTFS